MRTNERSISAWIVKGLGGAVNMVADLSDGGIQVDGETLKDLRACIVRLASHYNYHAQRSSLEPHERPRFFGAEHSYSQMVEHGELGPTQPASEVERLADRSTVQPIVLAGLPGEPSQTDA